MRNRNGRIALSILVGPVGIALTALVFAPPAAAWRSERGERERRGVETRDDFFEDNSWNDWPDYWYSIEKQRISSQEEQQREAGREKRRDELEQKQKADLAAHEQYFDAVMDASRFSSQAPQGLYYRKPGFVTTEPPAGAERIQAGSSAFLYDRGIFFLDMAPRFVTVAAPLGAVVGKLPDGSSEVTTSAGRLHYYFGTYFAEKDGKFVVTRPPSGTLVGYLPDGYTEAQVGGGTFYRFGDVFYKPYFAYGILTFMVVEI